MKAIIITIGDEILMGQTLDTNSQYIAKKLTSIGIQVSEMLSVQDQHSAITHAVHYSMHNASVVIVTGGLGPTRDDKTKSILADYFGTKVELNPEAMSYLEELLISKNLPMNENNRSQAYLPKGCRVLQNFKGTAAGMWFEKDDKILISLPGVPFEMEHLMDTYIEGDLKSRFPDLQFEYRMLKVYDFPESGLAHHLEAWEDRIPEGYSLAYLPTPGMVKLRITAHGDAIKGLDDLFINLQQELNGSRITLGDDSIETQVGKLLKDKGMKLAVAESCTGGEIASMITSVSGSSEYFLGSVTAYDNRVKSEILGVDMYDIKTHGAVSECVVSQMAEGVRTRMGADIAVATSGVAGPGGGTEFNPVGTVWIAVSTAQVTKAQKFRFSFTRERNISKAATMALELILRELL